MKSTAKKEGVKGPSRRAAIATAKPRSLPDGMRERIASKAYELWELRGHREGHDLRDWLDAESLAQARRTEILRLVDGDVLEMHPEDAETLGWQDGELVRLVSARADALLPLVLSERVQRGQLFTSFHFPGSRINRLLSSSADESSKCPEYKVSAVRVERITCESARAVQDAALVHARLIM
jgi:anaerobic selenocysteine-containing dehydrogenase